MSVTRRISERRPLVLLIVLMGASLVMLASGTQGSIVSTSARTLASAVSMPFVAVASRVEGTYDYLTALVFEFEETREEAAALRQSFATMLHHTAQRQELKAENARLREMLAFRRTEPQFTLFPVEVIQHSPGGVLTIDQGSVHGIRPSMCVVSPDGVIGMVTQVDPFTSNVVTLQHPDCRIDVMVQRNRVRGLVQGTGNDLSRLCYMRYIDLKDDIHEGDTVVTSPDSMFPSGYPVGTVTTVVYDEGSLLKAADVQPAVDPYRVDEVFVLLDADRPWHDLVETPQLAAADVPLDAAIDTMSIQERYAP